MAKWLKMVDFGVDPKVRKTTLQSHDNYSSQKEKTLKYKLRPRPHVSGYFLIRNFFFPDTAIVHTHTANSQAHPEIF